MLERLRRRRRVAPTNAGAPSAPTNAGAAGPAGAAGDGEPTPARRSRASAVASGAAAGGRGVLSALAALVRLVTGLIALLIVIAIAFVVLKANKDNSIVKAIHDAAKFFVGPFDGMFKPKSHRLAIAINWGIAAALYAFVGSVIARLLRRP